MGHSIRIDPAPRKFLDNIDAQTSRRIIQAINRLSSNPRPAGCKKERIPGFHWAIPLIRSQRNFYLPHTDEFG